MKHTNSKNLTDKSDGGIFNSLKTYSDIKPQRNILSLRADEALAFFMNSERFCGFELPEYFKFDSLLQYIQEIVADKSFSDCCTIDPAEETGVNLEILLNKDGKYGVRPLTLVNPYLYYFLCREVCKDGNWSILLDCFKSFTVPHINSCAIPVIPKEKEAFHKSTIILNWWNSMEQRSLELSLEYRYMFVSDITNCYGSINPQSIDWALSMKGTSYANDKHHDLAMEIIRYIKSMQQGRNIGIPQGSTIFDFVGEIVLGYADLLLHEAIERSEKESGRKFSEYEILRYRDDYRIFSNNKDELEQLSYILQQVLEGLNFRMNTSKTRVSESLVTDSIKSDKLAYIYNTPIFNKKGCDFDGIQKHLLYLLIFAREYPNAGQLKNMLTDLDNRIIKRLKLRKEKITEIDLENGKTHDKEEIIYPHIKENKKAIIAVATQLAVENVSIVNYALRIISRILNDIEDQQERKRVIALVYERLSHQPNSTYTQVWLQNITYPNDVVNNTCPYTLPLCELVMGKQIDLWNNTWLKAELTDYLPINSIVDKDTLSKNNSVIVFRETRAYYEL